MSFIHLPRPPVGGGEIGRMPEPQLEMAAWIWQKLFTLASRIGKQYQLWVVTWQNVMIS